MMQFENNYYRTSDYLLDIEFLFVDLGASIGWRIYILSNIDYKQFSASRSDSITTIHRLTETNREMLRKINAFQRNKGRTVSDSTPVHYICWKYKIDSLDRAREIAKTWSEITAYYIRNGGSFESIQPKLKRKGIIRL
jgi:hypothetical protein